MLLQLEVSRRSTRESKGTYMVSTPACREARVSRLLSKSTSQPFRFTSGQQISICCRLDPVRLGCQGQLAAPGKSMTALKNKEIRSASVLQSRCLLSHSHVLMAQPLFLCDAGRVDDCGPENHQSWCHNLRPSMVFKLANMEHTYLFTIPRDPEPTAYQHLTHTPEQPTYSITSRSKSCVETCAVRSIFARKEDASRAIDGPG